mmetsp:Transcript_26493/g.37716  ORF Transcript_26493/g.37716 Transcript_26493/m.37716 type:complete len:200 (+) Transcript_26493:183-782(+)
MGTCTVPGSRDSCVLQGPYTLQQHRGRGSDESYAAEVGEVLQGPPRYPHPARGPPPPPYPAELGRLASRQPPGLHHTVLLATQRTGSSSCYAVQPYLLQTGHHHRAAALLRWRIQLYCVCLRQRATRHHSQRRTGLHHSAANHYACAFHSHRCHQQSKLMFLLPPNPTSSHYPPPTITRLNHFSPSQTCIQLFFGSNLL